MQRAAALRSGRAPAHSSSSCHHGLPAIMNSSPSSIKRAGPSSCCRAVPPEQQQQQDAPQQQQPGASGGGVQLNEDMLAQLRAAQEEAARLKKELSVLQQRDVPGAGGGGAAAGAPGPGGGAAAGARPRIDSIDNREMPWGAGKRTAWLSEADVDFFTGGGATEAASSAPGPEEQAAIGRRLALGGAAAAGLAAFALVPSSSLQLAKPGQPMFFYITQLLQAQAQLDLCGGLIAEGQWGDLRLVLPRIKGPPTNAEAAAAAIVSLLGAEQGPAVAESARQLASEFFEYVALMDYNAYYDAMPGGKLSGGQAAEFVTFSSNALRSARQRLAALLALLPAEQLEAARAQLDSQAALMNGQ